MINYQTNLKKRNGKIQEREGTANSQGGGAVGTKLASGGLESPQRESSLN
jgi:hypothetical protein